MRNVSLNSRRYKLPSGVRVPTTTPFSKKKFKRNAPGSNFYTTTLFERIPDQSPKEKALLAVPQSRVQEKLITDYFQQAKNVEKTKLDGLKLDQDLVFETFEKLKSKERKRKKESNKKPKKSEEPKKVKKTPTPNFALSS